jgi:hypothetical protein
LRDVVRRRLRTGLHGRSDGGDQTERADSGDGEETVTKHHGNHLLFCEANCSLTASVLRVTLLFYG